MKSCTIKHLPEHLAIEAAATAREHNPANRPHCGPGVPVLEPLHIALLTSKYWGPQARTLSVSFTETTPADLRTRILGHMNAWSQGCGIRFAETKGTGQVRISRRRGGYWSYLGTDILHIPANQPTMNLEAFSMQTPESEYLRVVRHETGHTLGFPHEHMRQELVARLDAAKTYAYFLRTYGWDRQTVTQQVLTPLAASSLMGTSADQTSIMCYQLPATITKDGKPIPGGTDINTADLAFAGKIYPKVG